MNKGKISVNSQLEDRKTLVDAEAKDRASLLTKFAMKLRVWDALENLKELVQNSKPKFFEMESLLMFSKPKLQMLKSQRADLVQTLMIFQWNMNVSIPLLSWLSKANH